MAFSFSDADLQHIGKVLGIHAKHEGSVARFELHDEASARRIVLEITRQIALPEAVAATQPPNLVSVYATNSFLQLQGCTSFIASEELGEVIFFAKRGSVANGLVVESGAGCSLYANVDERLLSTDFTQLPPELIMSSVVLSIFDDIG